MRIASISDTHNLHFKLTVIPDADVLIVAGDMTVNGSLNELASFSNYLRVFAHDHKLIVAGNHDRCLENESLRGVAEGILDHAVYLRDKTHEIDGVRFFGSPWTPEFENTSFNVERGEALRAKWSQIPNDTDVLITHCPPKGILDKTGSGKHVGCADLLERVREVKPSVHVFGHIHESFGETKARGTRFVNASFKGRGDGSTRHAVVIDL